MLALVSVTLGLKGRPLIALVSVTLGLKEKTFATLVSVTLGLRGRTFASSGFYYSRPGFSEDGTRADQR